ncbi:MAG: hypothetical protein KAR18_09265 [Spirochaetes bacterium]|nr:hypothetical protein [Spirochaetota bacterium]
MNTKLTLRMEKEIIEQIKMYAMDHDKSVSSLTETLYKSIIIKENEEDAELTPIAKKYKGIIKNDEVDTDIEKLNYLLEKHLK